MPRSPAGSWSSSSSGSGRSRWSTTERASGQSVAAVDVGEQQPDVGAEHPHQQEEVLVDGDQAERAAVAGVATQLDREPVEVGGRVVVELLDLPDTLLAVGDQGEVDALGRWPRTPRTCPPPRDDRDPACPRGRLLSRMTGRPPSHQNRGAGTRLTAMRIHVADHPLVAHKLTTLRDEDTDSPTFRRLADELVTLLAYEATRDVRVAPVIDPDAGGRGAGREAGQPEAAGRADPAGRARHARRHDAAAADGRGRLPRHGAQRGDAGGVDVRRAAARGPVRPAVLRARPDAGDRRHAGGGDPVPGGPRRRPHHRDLPAGRARGLRAAGEGARARSTSR